MATEDQAAQVVALVMGLLGASAESRLGHTGAVLREVQALLPAPGDVPTALAAVAQRRRGLGAALGSRLLIVGVLLLAIGVLVGGAVLAQYVRTGRFQEWIVFNPRRQLHRYRRMDVPPYATVRVAGRLDGWYFPAAGTKERDRRTAILYLHGRSGNMGTQQRHARFLGRLGLPMLFVDYTGYGRSPGRASEESSCNDGVDSFDYLRTLGHDRIIVYGYSLGGAVAAHVATQRRCTGLALVATFAEIGDAMPLGTGALWRGMFHSEQRIRRARPAPTLVAYSRDDVLIPPTSSRRLFAAAPRPKMLVKVTGPHARLNLDTAYLEKLQRFVRFSVRLAARAESQDAIPRSLPRVQELSEGEEDALEEEKLPCESGEPDRPRSFGETVAASLREFSYLFRDSN
jgi:pimeloyl-ACP methyl ester carboxylesterase